MNTEKTFDLSLDFEGEHYQGKVIPSEELGKNGMPVYYRVTIGERLFAYLCCSDNGWNDRDGNNNKPAGLVRAIGNYITDYYE